MVILYASGGPEAAKFAVRLNASVSINPSMVVLVINIQVKIRLYSLHFHPMNSSCSECLAILYSHAKSLWSNHSNLLGSELLE